MDSSQEYKKQFPLLLHHSDLVYLDSAATTQKPEVLLDAYNEYYGNYNANVHRSGHSLGLQATEAYEGARSEVAAFCEADPESVVFTRNATEAINLIAVGLADELAKKTGPIMVTRLEHHSNFLPWQRLAQELGCELIIVDVTLSGVLVEADLIAAIQSKKPRLVACTALSNVTGQVIDIAQVVRACSAVAAVSVIDACQLMSKRQVNFTALGADFVVFSAHKVYGPMGLGVLLGKVDRLEQMQPVLLGGGMIHEVTDDLATFVSGKSRFEAGTPNVADAFVFAAVLRWLGDLEFKKIVTHEQMLLDYLLTSLRKLDYVTILADDLPVSERAGVVSFVVAGVHSVDVNQVLSSQNIAVRAGSHCCEPFFRLFNFAGGVVRVSLGMYSTTSDVDTLITGIELAYTMLHK